MKEIYALPEGNKSLEEQYRALKRKEQDFVTIYFLILNFST